MDNKEIIYFIKSLYPEYEQYVPLHAPVFFGNEKKYVNDCIDTTYVSSVGQYVDQFEMMLSEFTGSAKTVVCVNGTNALFLALKLSGVCAGDEVITQPLTFIATANAISYCSAKPVFIDVDEETMGLSPSHVEQWLKENAIIRNNQCFNKKTNAKISACMPMHTFGHPVKINELVRICNEWNIILVEDAAESIGSYYKGQHTGTFSNISGLSFNGNKTITTGGGGCLLFKNTEQALYAKHLTTQAKIPHKWDFKHDEIGYNYRMPNINAALGCAQMESINRILDSKRKIAMKYKSFFQNTEIQFFDEPEYCKSNFWLNAVLLPNKAKQINFLEETNGNNIQTRPIWELMNNLNMFKKFQCGSLRTAIMFSERVVNLPSGYHT